MLMVGARRQTAPRALASSARRRPAFWRWSCENVAPRAVALGRAEAGPVKVEKGEINEWEIGPTRFEKGSTASAVRAVCDFDAASLAFELWYGNGKGSGNRVIVPVDTTLRCCYSALAFWPRGPVIGLT